MTREVFQNQRHKARSHDLCVIVQAESKSRISRVQQSVSSRYQPNTGMLLEDSNARKLSGDHSGGAVVGTVDKDADLMPRH